MDDRSRSATQRTDKRVGYVVVRRPCVVCRCSPMHECMRRSQTENWLCRLFFIIWSRKASLVVAMHHACTGLRERAAYVIPGRQMTLMTWRLLNRSNIYTRASTGRLDLSYTYIIYVTYIVVRNNKICVSGTVDFFFFIHLFFSETPSSTASPGS